MHEREATDRALVRRLVLDELVDLSLYQSLRELMKRRVVANLVTIAAAVGITFAIGLVANRLWGVSI